MAKLTGFENWTMETVDAHNKRVHEKEPGVWDQLPIPELIDPSPKKREPTKTELEYASRLALEFPNCKIVFEGISVHLDNGHRYKPDWVVHLPDDRLLCVEVKARGKNGFRQLSYRSAKIAYDQSKIDWPMFQWRWAEKYQGEWRVTQ